MTAAVPDRESLVADLFPYLRGAVSSNRRTVGHHNGSDDALAFANSAWAEELCALGTSCPDHFLRTRISPMFALSPEFFFTWHQVPADPGYTSHDVASAYGLRVDPKSEP